VRHPHRGLLEGVPEAFLALSDRLGRPHAFGHVAAHHHHAFDLA